MDQNTVKESPNIYLFLALVFIILSIILISIELQEHYEYFKRSEGTVSQSGPVSPPPK